jgi:endo-1,4-beta-xylanase
VNPDAAVAVVALALLSCAEACTGGEPIAGIEIGSAFEARVRAGIEQNRKSGARITVVDAKGRGVAGARVSVRQISHDFLFGCAFPMWTEPPKRLGDEGWANWNRYFTRIFNYATSENALKWGPMEPEEGRVRWEATDFMISWCRERNIRIKGHNLIWALPKHGFPEWLEKYPPEEIARRARERILMVMARVGKDVPIWDVVNEPVHCHALEKLWGKDYVLDSYKWAREASPDALLVINDYAGFRGDVDIFVPMVKDLLKKGAPIDAIGEQAHDPPHWYSPKEVFETLDKMASTGLSIHLTELTYPSNGADITDGFINGKWDEENQGRFYRYFVTLCFSHPKVDAITLWAMWDGSSWLKLGGIIREDWTPKPAYYALDDLINNKWKTRFEARTDEKGEVRFRGFHGEYEVEVKARGKSIASKLHLSQGAKNDWQVQVP